MMQYYIGHMGWGFGSGWIIMIIFWGLIVWAIVALVHAVSGHSHGHYGHNQDNFEPKENIAMNILKERYAKGEISKEDFDKMKKDLE